MAKSKSKSKSNKRDFSVFDAVDAFESEDAQAETRRRLKATRDAKRAKAMHHQIKVYNQMLECRILAQRALTATASSETGRYSKSVDKVCNQLLNVLLPIRQALATNSIASLEGSSKENGDDDDDNNDDDDNDDVSSDYTEMIKSSSSQQLDEVLQQEYDVCRQRWKTVLNKRQEEIQTRGGSGKDKFKMVDSSFWGQVESTVEFGKLQRKQPRQAAAFDDSRLYQQLLKEFLVLNAASSTQNADDNPLLAKKQMQKKRKDVDRRASKGRKIRYHELPKLVNFTFPLSRRSVSNLQQDEWFQSLFGGVGKL